MNQVPIYNTMTFCDIWPDANTFKTEYKASGYTQLLTDPYILTLYYLLYARYGNSPIANFDVNQWKYKAYSIIFQYGLTWEKRLGIQASLRALTDADLQAGSKAIYNRAFNPADAPGTGDLEELDYINEQNTTNYKRGILDAYEYLWNLLKVDVSENFLKQFRVLFKTFVAPEKPLLYAEEDEENE